MSSQDNNIDFDAVSDDERRAAAEFGDVTDTLSEGRRGLDALPDLAEDDAMSPLIPMLHSVRAQGSSGHLAPSRQDAVWDDIEGRLEAAASRAAMSRPRVRWWQVVVGLGVAAAAIFIVFYATRTPVETGAAPTPPDAVAAIEKELPSYAAQLMTPGDPPRGDTRLRTLREAHFDAWRTDASWNHRYRASTSR